MSEANTHTATSNPIARASALSQSRSNPTAAWMAFRESGSLNIEVCNLTEGILGGWRDGEEREKPPAAGLANLLSSHWRCYRERGWKSRAADSHVISYSLLACSFLAGLYVCVCRRCVAPTRILFLKSIRRRSTYLKLIRGILS